jgi:hypothetical protein
VEQVPDWEVKTATLISEAADLCDMLKAGKAKYKERMLAVGGQNKVLRQVSFVCGSLLCFSFISGRSV